MDKQERKRLKKEKQEIEANAYLAHKHDKILPGKTTAQQAERAEDHPTNYLSGKPYSQRYRDILQKRRLLPVHKQREEFLELIHKHQILVLVGETGSGKTTQYILL